jgi:hypothetical protein
MKTGLIALAASLAVCSLALAADAVPANRFENLWRHRVEAAQAGRQEATAWYDERIAAIAAEMAWPEWPLSR